MDINYLREVAKQYKLILFDIWGVLLEDSKLYPGIAEEIAFIAEQTDIIFLSNSPRPNFIVADYLFDLGIKSAQSSNIITAGDITRKIIKRNFPKKEPVIFHLGADRNKYLLSDIAHKITDQLARADIFLLSLYRDADENLTEFDLLLKEVAREASKRPELLILCANPDTAIPCGSKTRYCAGYFAEIITKAGGSVIYTGKPHKIIYEELLERYVQLDRQKILMVGDTFETDILGANQAGIASALTITGNAAKYHREVAGKLAKADQLARIAKERAIYPNFITYLTKNQLETVTK